MGSLLISRISFCNWVKHLFFQNLMKATKVWVFCTRDVGNCSQLLSMIKVQVMWKLGYKAIQLLKSTFPFFQWHNRFSSCYWQISEGYISYSDRLSNSWYCRHWGSLREIHGLSAQMEFAVRFFTSQKLQFLNCCNLRDGRRQQVFWCRKENRFQHNVIIVIVHKKNHINTRMNVLTLSYIFLINPAFSVMKVALMFPWNWFARRHVHQLNFLRNI